MPARARSSNNRLWRQVALLWGVFSLVLVQAHAPFWKLPYYWDELGQFVPQALDLLDEGRLIPVHTTPNVHPPGVMAILALVWKIAGGHSIPLTRITMLLLASLGGVGAFVLSIRLSRGAPGAPAFAALGLLLSSPLFYTQSMMAQLDMPAMVFSTWALLFFLEDRLLLTAVFASAAVLMKETALVLPAVLALWLAFRDRRPWRDVLLVAVPPAAVLLLWVAFLWSATGHPLGEVRFADYNAIYSLHPIRLGAALLRRLHYLFFAEFRWIGTVTIVWAWRSKGWFRKSRDWAVVAIFAAAHTVVVSLFGGAVLERYLLPVLPVLFAAFAISFMALTGRWRVAVPALAVLGSLVCLKWYPSYPFPLENNLAMVDFVEIHQLAASHISDNPALKTVATVWPFSDALRRPEFGYASRPVKVVDLPDFGVDSIRAAALDPKVDGVLIYRRDWDEGNLLTRMMLPFRIRFYQFVPEAPRWEIESQTTLHRDFRWDHNRMWAELYRR